MRLLSSCSTHCLLQSTQPGILHHNSILRNNQNTVSYPKEHHLKPLISTLLIGLPMTSSDIPSAAGHTYIFRSFDNEYLATPASHLVSTRLFIRTRYMYLPK